MCQNHCKCQELLLDEAIRVCLARLLCLGRSNLDASDLTRRCWHGHKHNAVKEMYRQLLEALSTCRLETPACSRMSIRCMIIYVQNHIRQLIATSITTT